MTKEIKTIEDLYINPRNPNKGHERGNWQLEESLRRYGAGRSILIDKEGRIIAGNHVVEIAGQLGLNKVKTIKTSGDEIIAVQREDLDLENDETAKALVYVDNRVSETNYVLDVNILLEDLVDGLDLSSFYMEEELEYLVAEADVPSLDGMYDVPSDEPEEIEDEQWQTIKLSVPASTKEHFYRLMSDMPGDAEHEQLKRLLEFVEQALMGDFGEDE